MLSTDHLKYSIFMPSWLNDILFSQAFKGDHPFPLDSHDLCLIPKLDLSNLGIFVCIFSSLQHQLSSLHQPSVHIAPDEWLYAFGQQSKVFKDRWNKVLSSLSCSQLLGWNGNETWKINIFDDCKWKVKHEPIDCRERTPNRIQLRGLADEGKGSQFVLNLTLSDTLLHLSSGYIEAYTEHHRKKNGLILISRLLKGRGPLVIEKSLWLDLKGIEYLTYLLIKKNMQWNQNSLQKDTFFLNYREIIEELREHHPSSRPLSFEACMKFAKRILVKMNQHGFLQELDKDRYFAFARNEKLLFQMIYQNSCYSNYEAILASYQQVVTRKYVLSVIAQKATLEVHLGVALDEQDFATLVGFIGKHSGSDLFGAFVFDQVILVPHLFLILEWFYATPVQKANFVKWSVPFMALLQQHTTLRSLLDHIPLLMSKIKESEYLLKKSLLTQKGLSLCQDVLPKGRRTEAPLPQPRVPKTDPIVKKATIKDAIESFEPKQQIISSKPKRSTHWAHGELLKLKSTDADRYESLRKAYLETLEEAEKKLFIAIRQKLSPDMFEKQLQPRLIKYLSDNPQFING